MKRKINRVGTSTLTVSLPSKWARKYGINPGDEVDVVEDGKSLVLGTKNIKKASKKISFNITKGTERIIRNYIYGSYKHGFDEIEVYFKDQEIAEKISDEVEKLIGYEIISQKKNYFLVKNVASPLKETFGNLVNKTFLLTTTFAQDMFDAFNNKNASSLKTIKKLELTQNKLSLACMRIMVEDDSIVPYPQTTHYIISELESLGDDLKYICDYYEEKEIILEKETKLFFEEFVELLTTVSHLYMKFNIDKFLEITDKRAKLVEKGNQLVEAGKKDQRVLINYLLSSSLKCHDIIRNTFQVNIKERINLVQH